MALIGIQVSIALLHANEYAYIDMPRVLLIELIISDACAVLPLASNILSRNKNVDNFWVTDLNYKLHLGAAVLCSP